MGLQALRVLALRRDRTRDLLNPLHGARPPPDSHGDALLLKRAISLKSLRLAPNQFCSRSVTRGRIAVHEIRVEVLTFLATFCLAAPVASQSYEVERNVVYGMYSGTAFLMDVHRPPNINGRGMVWIKGIGWRAPDFPHPAASVGVTVLPSVLPPPAVAISFPIGSG